MPWVKDYDNPGFTERDAVTIIAKARDLAPLSYPKRYADLWAPFFALCWYTGRRAGELLRVLLRDIGEATLTYTPEKRIEPRATVCPVPPWLAKEIVQVARSRHLKAEDRVFPFSLQAIDKAVKRCAAAAGLTRHVHVHMFRHGHGRHLAREMQRQGVDSRVIEGAVKRALDHAAWSTARTYLQPGADEMAEWQRRAFGPGRNP